MTNSVRNLAALEWYAVLVDGPGDVESGLEPGRHAVGEFRRGIEGVVGDQPAGKIRLGAALDRVIEMMLRGPLADFGDLASVDLDLVIGAGRHVAPY